MRVHVLLFTALLIAAVISSCGRQKPAAKIDEGEKDTLPRVAERLAAYAPTSIRADMAALTTREKKLVAKLVEAGKLADAIFWKQASPDAVFVRDSLAGSKDRALRDYVAINYGPYDRIFEGKRFVGGGPRIKPPGASYYPEDMTKEEFEKYVAANPAEKEALESQYTNVVREGGKLKAIAFHAAYPAETGKIAMLLEEAATLADNPSLRKYLRLRAKAILTDDYYESDMAWMDLKDNSVDIIIGPIENYEDALFNYKTAYECAVVVKDPEGTASLEFFRNHIDGFERALPIDRKYIRKSAGTGNVLEIVNVVYFGGDFQKGVKTIAASLPNDPRVTQAKGGKKQMFRNLMEAKFEKILVPIAQKILDTSLLPFVDRKAFIDFVTLHEVSHTLGRGYVFGNDSLSVRRALKDRYSAIEEAKADVLGLHNNQYFLDKGLIVPESFRRSIVTYVVGLFRSLRFGANEAHGQANLIQLNFLHEKGGVTIEKDGKVSIDDKRVRKAIEELARLILMIEAEGNYDEAGKMIRSYGSMNSDIERVVELVKDVPRDLNTDYSM
jgi:hypothetical protein